jgi:hypothetical protein
MAFPQVDTPSGGPLTAADLEAARKHSTGTVRLVPAGCGQNRWPERRVQPQPAEACTEVGHNDAAESMWRYRRTRATVGRVMLLALAAYASHLLWPMLKVAA